MAEIQLSLSKMTIPEKLQLTRNICTAMTGNANFTTPNPTLVAMLALATALETASNDYENEKATVLKNKLNVRDAAAVALDGGLRKLAGYARNTTDDAAKLQSGGFSIKGLPVAVGPMTQVLSLVLTAGDNDGTLDAAWDPTNGAMSYEIQISPDPMSATSWAPKMTATKSSATLLGLTSGSRVWVRVRAMGAGNLPGPWSDPAVKTVP